MALLYGRAGRLTARHGGFRPRRAVDDPHTLTAASAKALKKVAGALGFGRIVAPEIEEPNMSVNLV